MAVIGITLELAKQIKESNKNGSITESIWSILYQQDGQLSFDEESGKWGTGIEAYNIFYNQYSNLSEPLSYPPPDGGDEPVTFFNPGRFFCSCQTLEEAKKRMFYWKR